MGLGSTFTFLGYRPDVLRLLAGGDMFALASHFEGYPIAVMEAMAMGLPVVATNVGGMWQATGSGERGLLVEPGRPEELAKAIVALSDDAEQRAAMSDRSKKFASPIRHSDRGRPD